jgi:hypothetical protein
MEGVGYPMIAHRRAKAGVERLRWSLGLHPTSIPAQAPPR